jgi:hypothetical protein
MRDFALRVLAIACLIGLCDKPGLAVDLAKIDRTIAKEPNYHFAYQEYCLLVLNPNAKTRIWIIRDGEDMYVDLNGNGDLTEPAEKIRGGYQAATTDQFRFNLDVIPTNGVGGTKYKRLNVLSYSNFPEGVWHLSAQVNDNDFWQSAGKIRPTRSAADAPVVHVNGGVSVIPYFGERFSKPRRLATSVQFERGKSYPLALQVGKMGVGEGASVSYESRELLGVLKDSVVQARLESVSEDGTPTVTTQNFTFRADGDP